MIAKNNGIWSINGILLLKILLFYDEICENYMNLILLCFKTLIKLSYYSEIFPKSTKNSIIVLH